MKMISYANKKDGVAYEPEYMGNRELSEDERFYVVLGPLTQQDKNRYDRMLKVRNTGKRRKQEFQTNADEIQRATFLDKVYSIHNLQIVDASSGESIENPTPEQLYDLGDPELITEILEVLQDRARLSEGEKKR